MKTDNTDEESKPLNTDGLSANRKSSKRNSLGADRPSKLDSGDKKLTSDNSGGEDEAFDNAIYKRITNIFIAVGLPAHINGFHFLRDAIMLAAGNFDMISGITKKLYPLVAKRFNTTTTTVEQGIRNAISVMWNRGRPESMDSVLGIEVYKKNSRPTSAEFIALLAERVYLDCICS